jgi:hypothetical protein
MVSDTFMKNNLLSWFQNTFTDILHLTPSIVVLGIAITNAAPALANPDPLVFKLSDILCVNESEVCIIHVVE